MNQMTVRWKLTSGQDSVHPSCIDCFCQSEFQQIIKSQNIKYNESTTCILTTMDNNNDNNNKNESIHYLL